MLKLWFSCMTENPGAGELGCCKVLSIELVFDHSWPCLECRPSAVILERYVINVRTRGSGSSYSLMCI